LFFTNSLFFYPPISKFRNSLPFGCVCSVPSTEIYWLPTHSSKHNKLSTYLLHRHTTLHRYLPNTLEKKQKVHLLDSVALLLLLLLLVVSHIHPRPVVLLSTQEKQAKPTRGRSSVCEERFHQENNVIDYDDTIVRNELL
jgi:hypothetical protein